MTEEDKSILRVSSTIMGYYFGSPGTITGKAQVQYGDGTRYKVLLDTGDEIVLSNTRMRRLNEKKVDNSKLP